MPTLLRLLARAAITVLLAAAGLSLIAYLTTPLFSAYRDDLAAALGARLGVPVSIGRMEPRWRGYGPMLRLRDVELGSGADSVRLEQARLDFYLPGLWDGDGPGPLRLTLRGMRLRLVRDAGGEVHVHGLPRPGGDAAADRHLVLPARLRLQHAEVVWEDLRTGRPPLRIAPINLDLAHAPDGLRGAAQLASPNGDLQLAVNLSGDLGRTDWSGEVRLLARDLDLAALLGDYLPAQYRLSGLRLDADLVSTWQDALPSAVRGRVDVRDLRLAGAGEVAFQRLGGTLQFARRGVDGWQLRIDGLDVAHAAHRWPPGAIAVDFDRQADGRVRIRAGADFLCIEDLLAVLQVRAPRPDLGQAISDLQPRGRMYDVQLALDYGADHFDWRAAARFRGMQIRRFGSTPGVHNLSGSLRGHNDHLQIDLDSAQAALDLGDLFRAPLQLERLAGRIDWLKDAAGGWTLRSDDLQVDTPALRTRNRLALVTRPDRPPLLDLQSDFRDGDASQAGDYYPVRIMRPQLVAWLDRAIGNGRVTQGTAVVHGPLPDFPFNKTHNGHFEVLFEARDLDLAYQVGWPPLQQVAARVRFHGNALDIDLQSARIYDSTVLPTRARFVQLAPATPIEIAGRVTGPLADNLRLLAESPLGRKFGNFVRGLRASGNTVLDLDFAVPVHRLGEYRLAGQLQFQGAHLELVDWDLPLDDIHGVLEIDLESLRARDIRARGLGTDLQVDVGPVEHATRITARGDLGVPALQERLPRLPLQRASGGSAFTVTVDVPGVSAPADTPAWLAVESDLRGIALELPAPLGKPAASAATLRVQVPVGGAPAPLQVRYRDLVDAVIATDFGRGEIRLGGASAQFPDSPVLRLRGALPELDLAAWLPLAQDLGGGTGPPLPLDAELQFDAVRAGTITLDEVRLGVRRTAAGWQGEAAARQFEGSFAVPEDLLRQPVRLALQHLTLGSAADSSPPRPPGAPDRLDPRQWPALQLQCDRLSVGGAPLGELRVQARRGPRGLQFTELALDGAAVRLQASGSWRQEPDGPRTRLAGELSAPKLGALLRQLGFTPQLRDAPAEVKFDLSWPGDPGLFSDRRFDGSIDLALGQGRLLEIEPGVGRVVGLLNFNALQRRLRLDFSDLFKKGLSFDRIDGHFDLVAGDAHTDDLVLDGPTGKIEISGRTGLVARDLDQQVSLTPRLDATLPVAGAIAGGPVAGLAVLLAQQAMSKQVDEINRIRYSVKGPWEDPQVEQLAGGGSLSRLLRTLSGDQRKDAAADPGEADGAAPPADDTAPGQRAAPHASGPPPAEAPPAEPPQRKSAVGRLFEKLNAEGTGDEFLESTE